MSVEKRPCCDACLFLVEQCVCRWLTPLSTPLRVVVIQDPKEAKHAKNTVSLLRLVLPQLECIESDDREKLIWVLSQLDLSKWLLVFPSEESTPIEDLDRQFTFKVEGIILLDGTWRKAKKLYLTEPLLHRFEAVSFVRAPGCQYDIRKSPSDQALSTLEACAYALEQVTQQSMQPLRDFMVSAQQWQWRKQPLIHKHHKPNSKR